MTHTTPPTPIRRERTNRIYRDQDRATVEQMRKEGVPGPFSGNVVGKILLFAESKPVIATLLSFSVVMIVWNLQLYHDNLLSSSSCHCATTTSARTTATFLNTSTTPLVSLSAAPSRTTRPAPNKREFKVYGNAAALFVQMGAYRGGVDTFAIVGLASKPVHVYGDPWFKCEWVPDKPGSEPVTGKSYHILPDWGYGRVYTVVVVNCTFPTNPNADNSGGKLTLYAYYSPSHEKFEKFTALEESPGSYNESKFKAPFQYDYLYCGSSLYGTLNPKRIREWMAYHTWFFGPRSHFVFHDAGGMSAKVRAVLEPWVKLGRATVQDIRDQDQFDGYYYNQFLVVNDCLHRYRYAANWTFFFDVDEYIYLPEGNSLESVMQEFSNYTQFTIEQNPMSSHLCLNDSTQDYSRQWGFEKLLFRDSTTGTWKDRKYAIQARLAFATGVHMSENVVGEALHKTEDKIRYYHYHNTIQVLGEPCRVFLPPSSKWKANMFDKKPYVFDDKMKKLADTIKWFERKTLGNFSRPA